MSKSVKCDDCGKAYRIGDWPLCPHGTPTPTKGYEPHWDNNITTHPVWISNPGDTRKYLKPHWKDDHIVHVQEKY